MRMTRYQLVFQGMGKRAMANIVQQDGAKQPVLLLGGNFKPLAAQQGNRLLHQVHCPQGMVEAGVMGPRIDQVAHTHLGDPAEPLKIGMRD